MPEGPSPGDEGPRPAEVSRRGGRGASCRSGRAGRPGRRTPPLAPASRSSASEIPPDVTAMQGSPARSAALTSQTVSPTTTVRDGSRWCSSTAVVSRSGAGLPPSTSEEVVLPAKLSSAPIAGSIQSRSSSFPLVASTATKPSSTQRSTSSAVRGNAVDPDLLAQCGVALGVRLDRLLVLLAEQLLDQPLARDPDGSVDRRHRDALVAGVVHRLPPREDVEVVGVEQRAVDVEQDSRAEVFTHGGGGSPFPPGQPVLDPGLQPRDTCATCSVTIRPSTESLSRVSGSEAA